MSIFDDIYPHRSFLSLRDFEEVNRMLPEAIDRGHVESLTPLPRPNRVPCIELWYRDKEPGQIYSMSPPEPPSAGAWGPVDLGAYIPPESSVQ